MMVPISYVYYVQIIHKENSSCDTNLFWNGGIMTEACLKIGWITNYDLQLTLGPGMILDKTATFI